MLDVEFVHKDVGCGGLGPGKVRCDVAMPS